MCKLNNKGLSLVELLVALAISSLIVVAAITLISQGMKSTQKQTMAAQLQEDANIAMNQISDSIMETSFIDVSNYDSVNITKQFEIKKDHTSYSYKYDRTSQVLSINSSLSPGTDSVLCENVTRFQVQIINTSVSTKPYKEWFYIDKIQNPVQVKVTMEVSSGNIKRGISRVTGIRNPLSDITLQGFHVGALPDKDVLNDCQFLTY